MFQRMKDQIEAELQHFLSYIDTTHGLSNLSPLLFSTIKDFVLRDGKRLRPIFFVIGYLGYAKKAAPHLYTSALSIELLHDFMLVHDDIIDKSKLRRNKPSAHTMFNTYLKKQKGLKFSGEDLAIVMGDVMYASAIEAFLSIKEDPYRKEKALRRFIQAAVFTGCGEFIELLYGTTPLKKLTRDAIYKIYDYKTSHYTFSCPLSSGAILAGAPDNEVGKLTEFGIYLGRAFQINDDILGMLSEEKDMGKSALTDLQESKKTLLIWNTYQCASAQDKKRIEQILGKKTVPLRDLHMMRSIIRKCGSLQKTRQEISALVKRAEEILVSSRINAGYKNSLFEYTRKLTAPGS